MAYAHWEGFVKEACREYVKYVAQRRPKSGTLQEGLLVSCFMHLSRRISSGDMAAREALVEVIDAPPRHVHEYPKIHWSIPRRTFVSTSTVP